MPHPDAARPTRAARASAQGQRPNLAQYLRLGYAPQDACHCWGGAAETLEDSAADFALARLGAAARPREARTAS